MMYRIFSVLFCFSISVGFIFSQEDDFRYKLSVQLANQSFDDSHHQMVRIYLALDQQFNYEEWDRRMNRTNMTREQELKSLISQLRLTARNTQEPIIVAIKAIGAVNISQHWIANTIACTIDKSMIPSIARLEHIKWIGEHQTLRTTHSQQAHVVSAPAPKGREKGLAAIKAPEMWALGYTGYGGVVFTADTGIDPNHPALCAQYRGFNVGDKAAWFDASGTTTPFDCGIHGTHVTGTVLGLDIVERDTIGVAFNAQWIGSSILCGVGTEDNIAAFEWSLNPDGDSTTVDDIPHVINNSWYDPSLGGLDCYSIYVPILEAMEAAGIAVIFSAGNDGPDPSTISQPHNININDLNAFTVGALNGNSASLSIANFSSRGPSHCPGDGSLKIKPEVSAPGVNVRSCVARGTYGFLNGTSMASPHVSGAILLLREAFPYLKGRDFKEALYYSCTDLGAIGEDNVFGNGIINVFQAYQYLIDKGNVPVNPRVQTDVKVVKIRHALAGCNNQISPVIQVLNQGVEPVTSMNINITYGSNSVEQAWSGTILPDSVATIFMDPLDAIEGIYKFKVELTDPNGIEDERKLNNIGFFDAVVIDRASVANPDTIQGGLCTNSDIYLSPPIVAGKRSSVKWFGSQFGDDLIGDGSSPKITLDGMISDVFAEVTYFDQAGPTKSDNAVLAAENKLGILFDAHIPISLDSMVVYGKKTGIREFMLVNSFGDTINKLRRLVKQGRNKIALGWAVLPGTNYSLIKSEGDSLYVNPNEINYPFSDTENNITITGNTNNTSLYPYFYELLISSADPCGRIRYHLSTDRLDNKAAAVFSLNKDEFTLPDSAIVISTNISQKAISYLWEISDGAIYETENISHQFANSGKFEIKLTARDSSGCISQSRTDVLVKQATSITQVVVEPNEWFIYPNPTNEYLTIESSISAYSSFRYEILSATGQLVNSGRAAESSKRVDFSNLNPGVYFVKIYDRTPKVSIKKVIKL